MVMDKIPAALSIEIEDNGDLPKNRNAKTEENVHAAR